MPAYDRNNIFARILRGELPCKKVYEDAFALAFHDIHPQAPVHVLVIPKGDYISQADFCAQAPAELLTGFWRAVAKVAQDLGLESEGYRIVANHGPQGRAAGAPLPCPYHRRPADGPSHGQHRRRQRPGMIGRRALIAAGLSFPVAAAAKSPWKGYYAAGTRQRAVRFAGSDGATLAGTLLLPAWSELQTRPGHRAGGGQRADRPRRQQSPGAATYRRPETDRRSAGRGGNRHPALRQARHRRLDRTAARHARGAGAVLLVGQFRRRRGGRARRTDQARRDQGLRHGAARPQRRRPAAAGRPADDHEESPARHGAGLDARPADARDRARAGRTVARLILWTP